MPSPDLEKSLKLSDLRKLVREYDEKQEFGTFKKATDEEMSARINMLKEIHKLTETQIAFVNLYGKTEEKRRVEEQRQVRERLKNDSNFKAFLFQQTEGLRKSFHSTWDIKASDLGKGITKGLATFGLFGKFDPSSLIKKFDEYKGFTRERQEKVLDVRMLEKIEKMIITENTNIDDVRKFLQLNGLTNSKIADLLYQFNKGYKESVERIVHQGVLRHEETERIVTELEKKSLIDKTEKFKTEFDVSAKGIYTSPVSEVEKKTYETEVESGKELVRQGNLLSEINESLNKQVVVMEEEVRLTEEDRNRRKALTLKSEEKVESKGLFTDIFQSIPGIKQLLDWLPKVTMLMSSPLVVATLGIIAGGAIGYGISELIKKFFIGSKEKQDVNEAYWEKRRTLESEKEKSERELFGAPGKAYEALPVGSKKYIEVKKKLDDLDNQLAKNEDDFKVKMDELSLKEEQQNKKDEELKRVTSEANKNKWIAPKTIETVSGGTTTVAPALNTDLNKQSITQFNLNNKQGYRDYIPTDVGTKGQTK